MDPGTDPRPDLAPAAPYAKDKTFVAVVGVLIAAASVLQIVGGAGIMKGRRWGFVLTAVFAAFSILFHLQGVLHGTGLVGIAVHGVIVYYCWARLSGKKGPAPA